MKKSQIESILFFTGRPIDLNNLVKAFNIAPEELDTIIKELQVKYNSSSGVVLNVYDNKAILQANKINYDSIAKYLKVDKKKDLTSAAIEVLSIIAYKQPITKSEIDYIRGVKSDNILKRLLDEDFIYISGTVDGPGRPNLYSTTNSFLRRFNIESLSELPSLEVNV